jgi:hypothetical protein
MTEGNGSVLDFHLLPPAEIPERRIEFQDWQRFGAFRAEVIGDLTEQLVSVK